MYDVPNVDNGHRYFMYKNKIINNNNNNSYHTLLWLVKNLKYLIKTFRLKLHNFNSCWRNSMIQ